ncbi:MAG TPA: IS66 family transposase [Gammaproteobacteria bacterium]|nr:IS66 family transposase [Gammaproteobacteria bacterium]
MSDVAEIAERLGELEKRFATAEHERDEYRRLYLEMMERCRKLELGLLGSKSEHLPKDDSQLSLDVLSMMLGERQRAELDAALAAADEEQEVRGHVRRKPTGRKPIPEHLPRVEIQIVPREVEREGLDAFDRIGEEISEVLERRPASLVVARIVRGKFVRKDRDREATEVLIGEPLDLPILKGLAGPGMLADTIVKRWQDHLPLHRLEDVYSRDGLDLARSTMCGWHAELATLAKPLVSAMRADAFEQPYLCVDATGVLVQNAEKCRTGHFWVVVAPERHVLFEYTPEHSGSAVDDVLAGFRGYLVADAHTVYDHLYVDGDVVEVNCWAHARRYFFKALGSDPERAKIPLGLIGALFRIERTLANSPRKKREAIRQKRSAPIVSRFFSWCDAEAPLVLDDTPISDGIRYARNQRVGLSRFLEDGRLPIHNNWSELELRRQAVGRKNWLFVGHDEAGAVNATFTSLLASCRLCDVEPWAYLRDVLCLLPAWPEHRLLELSPVEWKITRDSNEVRNLLEQNPIRRLTLAPDP